MTAADEGRELLTLLWGDECAWTLDDLDEFDDAEIENRLEEMGYEWNESTETWRAT